MKKIILFLLITIPIFSFAQNEKATWDYPVKPGSKEWLAVPDFSKRLELLNIPASLLKKISTEELVKSCLNYPEFQLVDKTVEVVPPISVQDVPVISVELVPLECSI